MSITKAIAILEDTKLAAEAALRQALSLEGLPEPLLRRFAAYCAAEALRKARVNDARCWKAIEVGMRFSLGSASKKELNAANNVAVSVACDAVAPTSRIAAWATAWVVSGGVAWAASWARARAAARDPAWAAAGDVQRSKLLSMLRGESDFLLEDLAMYNFKERLKRLL